MHGIRSKMVFVSLAAMTLGNTGGRSGCGRSRPSPTPAAQCAAVEVAFERSLDNLQTPYLFGALRINPCAFEPSGSLTQGRWPDEGELEDVVEIVGLPRGIDYLLVPAGDPGAGRMLLFRKDVTEVSLADRTFELRYRPRSATPLKGAVTLRDRRETESGFETGPWWTSVALDIFGPQVSLSLIDCSTLAGDCGRVLPAMLCDRSAQGCIANFMAGSKLTLLARPAPNYVITGTSCGIADREASDGSRTLELTIDRDQGCSFETQPVSDTRELILYTSGLGTLGSSTHPECSLGPCAVQLGSAVELRAQPADGWKLARWLGACAIVEPGESPRTTLTLTITEDATCTAEFEPSGPRPEGFMLDLETEGEGEVVATLQGRESVRVSGSQRLRLPAGAPLQLVAESAATSSFVRWTGTHRDCRGESPAITLIMDVSAQCKAVFGPGE